VIEKNNNNNRRPTTDRRLRTTAHHQQATNYEGGQAEFRAISIYFTFRRKRSNVLSFVEMHTKSFIWGEDIA